MGSSLAWLARASRVADRGIGAQCWQNPRRLGWPEASSDEVGQVWNGGLVWDGEPGAEVVPEAEAELLAGFHQAQERSRQSRPMSLRVPPLTLRRGSVRARASKDRLCSRTEMTSCHAACKMASAVTLLRRWSSLRRSADTC